MKQDGRLSFITPADPAWAPGHFPGDPLMPGAKLLDTVIAELQAAKVLKSGPISVAQTKFTAPVRPGMQIDLIWQVTAGRVRYECSVAGQSVAAGQVANS